MRGGAHAVARWLRPPRRLRDSSALYLESLDEAPTPAGSTVAGFSLSPALLARPPGVIAPAEFVLRLAQRFHFYPDVLKQRVAALFRKMAAAAVFHLSRMENPPASAILLRRGDLWKAMLAGAIWSTILVFAQWNRKGGLRPRCRPRACPTIHAAFPRSRAPEYPLILIAAGSPPPQLRR